jgi:2-methylaconitate cis-trans-isomerase PrpF
MQKSILASLIRGGTSKGLFFKKENLPADKKLWDKIFLRAIGSPDNY